MNYWLLLVPFIGAFIGWTVNRTLVKMLFRPLTPKKILGFTFHGVFPKRQQELAEKLGNLVNDQFSPAITGLQEKISDPERLKKVMPVIETHIDEFLRVKLSKQMPMISMFIGDKTINSLKTVFMQEIETMLPEVIGQFTGNLQDEFDLKAIVSQKITAIEPARLEAGFRQLLAKELRLIALAGAATGFVIGLVQLLIAVLTS